MRDEEDKKPSWLIRTVVILGLILLGLVIFAVAKETYKKKQVEVEINQLKEEAAKIEKENVALADKISYFESKDYQEKEAKDKLNLQNPQENVVIIKPNYVQQEAPSKEENQSNDKKLVVRVSNVQKWWNYFFK